VDKPDGSPALKTQITEADQGNAKTPQNSVSESHIDSIWVLAKISKELLAIKNFRDGRGG
jgi:hypothetical protein